MSASDRERASALVRVRIQQRVEELHRESDGGDPLGGRSSQVLHNQEQSRKPSRATHSRLSRASSASQTAVLEHLRHDVVSVAAQILGRYLSRQEQQWQQQRQQERDGGSEEEEEDDAGAGEAPLFELRLVHHMLAKESELLRLQAQLPVPPDDPEHMVTAGKTAEEASLSLSLSLSDT